MLDAIGAASLDELIADTVPAGIRLADPPDVGEPLSEQEVLRHLRELGARNRLWRTHIGLGYHDCIVPPVLQRNIFENPGWYTQYTPYQAEIAQGRLEALLNFQTMVCDLTGMDVANASLLDEATAAAEAMVMAHGIATRRPGRADAHRFLASASCLPQTLDLLRTRAEPLGITVEVADHRSATPGAGHCGILLQYPGADGGVEDLAPVIAAARAAGVPVILAADLLALVLLRSPGSLGADIAVGSAQRFGVPLGYGGPHAAYFATRSEHIRHMPGRIIGVSVDANGGPALRMTLQTREQHIRREKATSNICTAQALLAIMAGMYAVYHGPEGLQRIAGRVHALTATLHRGLERLGYRQRHPAYVDTLTLDPPVPAAAVRRAAEAAKRNLRYLDDGGIGITLDETCDDTDVDELLRLCAAAAGAPPPPAGLNGEAPRLPAALRRTDPILTHPVFHRYRSETAMMRYLKSLENKDFSLLHGMIPLGSCTMKLNAAVELMPVSWPEFGALHPFVPRDQAEGYRAVFDGLERRLCALTGFSATSFQPNSGAQGEYTGLLVIRAWHRSRGDLHRTVALIPASAHGTNPASAVMAGFTVVVVKSDERGNIDVDDLRRLAALHRDRLGALMVTYPSTHGIFEESIREICALVHEHGGQVYMDGANLNAQVGLTSPAAIGADVCHINLHKTFSIPHGGGGPGMGPICVADHLAPFLPGHPVVPTGGAQATTAVAAAPFGSASILLISYAYIALLGTRGVTEATRVAILNANYLKTRLEPHYPVLYTGRTGRCAHEFILDLRQMKDSAGVDVEDVAKRLMDYGFHAPTVSFPVPGTLMVEPTESESKAELDRFVEAMIAIREEIREIEEGRADRENNVLKHAPHTAQVVLSDDWDRPYTRARAAYPVPALRRAKFWPGVGRVNNPHGDRNIVCTCPPVETYMTERAETAP
jgi:glycine dehydrogenase